MNFTVTGLRTTPRFDSELCSAPPDAQKAAHQALKMLMANPRANLLRLHPLTSYGKPMVFKIDIYANHSWQITFEMDNGTAILKRLATHKIIDRDPRG